ncbi:MAG TPA: YlbF family regulator [Candidatus Tetragenococcus pullicola]|nr:YlbF family regulator [Candidatus Tetragenococcus pullicola]
MDPLEKEPEVKAALDKLLDLLGENEVIQEFKAIQQRASDNVHLQELEEQIKVAQKEAVQYAHYEKPEAEKQAIARINALTKEYDEHPLVIAYREKLWDANELLHYVTEKVQKQVNQAIEEEETKHASKD